MGKERKEEEVYKASEKNPVQWILCKHYPHAPAPAPTPTMGKSGFQLEKTVCERK